MKRAILAGCVLALAGCISPLTQDEKDELLGAKATFEKAVDILASVEGDYERAKAEYERLAARVESGELSLEDYGKAKAELEVFLAAVESKWRAARDDVDSAANRLSEVQKQIKSRSGSGLGAWLQAILGGFGLEIPAGAFAVLEFIRRRRRDKEVGVLSRAATRLEDPDDEAGTFGAAVKAELAAAGMTANAMEAVKRDAAAGNL